MRDVLIKWLLYGIVIAKKAMRISNNIVTLQLIIITNNKQRISLIFYVSQATNIKWQAEAMAYLRACVVS